MASTTSPCFLDRLANCQLLDPERLAECRAVASKGDDAVIDHVLRRGLLTRFQVRQLRAGATNFCVGKYVVVDCLGRGANGIVYLARHRLLADRLVALKTVDTRNLHHGDTVARFRREIDIVARLDHPNVVRALDVLPTRTQVYLVLEYVRGKDLSQVVKERGPLPVAEAAAYAAQAARGLHYAHEKGVIHRDLKPANLLLTDDGVVKLSDLGLARLFEQDKESGLTVKGMALGTPEFMAPEQAEDAGNAGVRSDLYSLGATLFHLLTAELPVTGSSYLHRLQHLLTVPPRPLREARPDVPAELAVLVDRLRARDPQDRPASAEEVIALLAPFAREAAPAAPEWDAARKAALILEVLQGRATREAACARHRLEPGVFDLWQRRFLAGAERALDPSAAADVSEQLRELHAKIGAQAMEIEALKKRLTAPA